MKKKVTIVLVLLVMFILVILSFIGFSYYQTITTNQKNLTVLAQNRVDYASQRMLISQQKIEDQAATLLVDNEVRDIRQSVSNQHDYLLKLLNIRSKLNERLINGSEMASISIYWPQKDILISTESSPNLKGEMKRSPQLKGWRNTTRGLYFFMSYTFEHRREEETVVAIKAADSLLTDIQEALATDSDEAALLMPNGQIIGGSQELQTLIQKNKTKFQTAKQNVPFRMKHSDKQFMASTVANSSVRLITTLPVKQYDEAYSRNILFTLLAVLFVLAFGMTLIFLYYRNVLTEISLLTNKLKHVEQGDYDTRIEHLHQNEFDYLFNQFNLMTSSIQQLFKTLAKEMQQRELAEEKQFQTQIQPHFLYNSLFYIVSVADNPKAVREMTRHLADYYRYLSKEADRVYLKDEVEFARHYLTIQSLRKEFHFDIQMNHTLDQAVILPLLIQPIIENAIEHGIEAKDGAAFIGVLVKKTADGNIQISVSDDGPGLSETKCKYLHALINHPSRQTESIGLWNVNQRLKNVYGKEAGLNFSANEFGGLTVSFLIDTKGGILHHEMLDC